MSVLRDPPLWLRAIALILIGGGSVSRLLDNPDTGDLVLGALGLLAATLIAVDLRRLIRETNKR